jgi:hypothetical protein
MTKIVNMREATIGRNFKIQIYLAEIEQIKQNFQSIILQQNFKFLENGHFAKAMCVIKENTLMRTTKIDFCIIFPSRLYYTHPQGADPHPFPLRQGRQVELPTGIGKRFSQTISNLGSSSALAPM